MGLFAQPGDWIYLDPDYRVQTPKDKNGLPVLHCCRCQRPVKGSAGNSFRSVDVDWDNLQVRNNPLGKELIGADCWKQINEV